MAFSRKLERYTVALALCTNIVATHKGVPMHLVVTCFSIPLNKERRFTLRTSPSGATVLVGSLLKDVLVTSCGVSARAIDGSKFWITMWTRDILVGPDKVTDEGVNFHPNFELILKGFSNMSNRSLRDFVCLEDYLVDNS